MSTLCCYLLCAMERTQQYSTVDWAEQADTQMLLLHGPSFGERDQIIKQASPWVEWEGPRGYYNVVIWKSLPDQTINTRSEVRTHMSAS